MSSSILLKFKPAPQSLLHTTAANDVMSNGSEPEIDMSLVPEDSPRPQIQAYHSCFGLPYQDHNYVAPPPPTPPASPPPAPKVNGHIDIEDVSCNTVVVTTPVAAAPHLDASSTDDSVTRCICDFQHDDGYMICCDKCGVWQHVDCMGVDRNNIPDVYKCEQCEPRKVDKQRAIQIQTKKREFLPNILQDSSATETEDETPHGKSKKAAKGKKKERKENNKLNIKKKLKRLKKEKEKEGRRKQNNGQNRRKVFNLKVEKEKEKEKASKPKRNRKLTESNALAPPPCTEGNSPWETAANSYIEADTNNVCGDLQKILATRKFNGQHSRPDGVLPNPELLAQLYRVAQFPNGKNGLEAVVPIAQKMAVAEFKGNVLLRDQYDRDGEFYRRVHPYVLFYSRLEGLDICVDASRYGTDTRFVQRSCTPNCEVQAIIHNGDIHFYIFSSKGIEEGDEITIPFDFNYQECLYSVDCACSRPSCPVNKFHKLEHEKEIQQPLPSPPPVQPKAVKKRRRSTKSAEEKVEELTSSAKRSQSTSTSPGPPATKRRRPVPLSPLKVNATPKPETPILAMSDEEEHTSPGQSGYVATEPTTPNPSITMTAEEREAEAERRKKMTREERKMEAIMKAFEKLEKREERRKEAIARLGTTRKSRDSLDAPIPAVKEEPEPEPVAPVVPKEPQVESRPRLSARKGKKKSRPTTPARRQSRASSSISAADSSADENSSMAGSIQSLITPGTLSEPPSAASTATPCSIASDKMFRFPKTKKHLMNEWFHEKTQDFKPLSIKTDSLEVVEDEAEFVKCVPSPHTNSLSHLRRNSMSAAVGPRGPASGGSQPDHSMGSAKKRWLRQAMSETSHPASGSTSPIPAGSMSPNPNGSSSNSPGAASPVDFVTPLKKRRLARESIGLEGHPPNPSTPGQSAGEGSEVLSSAGTTPGSEEKAKGVDNKLRNGYRPHLSPVSSQGAMLEGHGSSSTLSCPDTEVVAPSSNAEVKTEPATLQEEISPPETSSLNSLSSSSDELSESKPMPDCQDLKASSIQGVIADSIKEEPQSSYVKPGCSSSASCASSLRAAVETQREESDSNVDTTDCCTESSARPESHLSVSQSSSSALSLFSLHASDSSRPDMAPMAEDRTLPQPSGSMQSDRQQVVHNSEAISSPGEGEDSDMAVSQTVDFVEPRTYPLPSAAASVRDPVDSSELLPTGGNVCDSTDTCSESQQTENSSLVTCSSALSDMDKGVVTSDLQTDSMNQSENRHRNVDNDRTCCSTTSSGYGALGERHFSTTASSSTDRPEARAVSETVTSQSPRASTSTTAPSMSREADSANISGWEARGSAEGMVGPASSSMPSNRGDSSVEEGELDSSFSDMESQSKKAAVFPLVDQTVSCSSDSRGGVVSGGAPVTAGEEKEEGEITDEDVDEVAVASTPAAEPSTSTSCGQGEQHGSGGSSEISSTNHRWSRHHGGHIPRASAAAVRPGPEEDGPQAGPSTSHPPPPTAASTSNRSISSTANTKNTHSEQNYSPEQDNACVDSSSAPFDKELSSSGENSAYSLNMENSVSSTASDSNEENYLGRNMAESSYVLTDTSPPAKSTSPSSSSTLSAGASSSSMSKKKVSLLEYRKRLKEKGISGSSKRLAASCGRLTPPSWEAPPTTLAPLPLFGQPATTGSEAKKKGGSESSLLGSLSDKEEQDVRWSVSATAAERMREQTPLSLTERLRREFGLDASEEEDIASDDDDDDDDEDDEPPPPPPPGQPSYQQPAGLLPTPHLAQVQLGAGPALLPTPLLGQAPRGVTSPAMMVPPPPPPPPPPMALKHGGRAVTAAPAPRGPPGPPRPSLQPPQLAGQRLPAPRQRGSIPSLLSLSFPPSFNGAVADSPGTAASHPPQPSPNSSQGQLAQGYGQSVVFESYESSGRRPEATSSQPGFSQPGPAGYAGQQGAPPAPAPAFNHGAAAQSSYHHCTPSSTQGPAGAQPYESYSTSSSTSGLYKNSHYPTNSYP